MRVYLIVCGFVLFDIITGIAKAFYEGNFNSTVMRKGGFHKFAELMTLIGSGLVQYACNYIEFGIELPVVNVVSVYISLMELISILENLATMNPEMAKLFKPYLEKLKDKDV